MYSHNNYLFLAVLALTGLNGASNMHGMEGYYQGSQHPDVRLSQQYGPSYQGQVYPYQQPPTMGGYYPPQQGGYQPYPGAFHGMSIVEPQYQQPAQPPTTYYPAQQTTYQAYPSTTYPTPSIVERQEYQQPAQPQQQGQWLSQFTRTVDYATANEESVRLVREAQPHSIELLGGFFSGDPRITTEDAVGALDRLLAALKENNVSPGQFMLVDGEDQNDTSRPVYSLLYFLIRKGSAYTLTEGYTAWGLRWFQESLVGSSDVTALRDMLEKALGQARDYAATYLDAKTEKQDLQRSLDEATKSFIRELRQENPSSWVLDYFKALD